MATNTPSQDLQSFSVRFNQLSDDVKKQFLEEQLKILNNDPQESEEWYAKTVYPVA